MNFQKDSVDTLSRSQVKIVCSNEIECQVNFFVLTRINSQFIFHEFRVHI